MLQNNEKQVYPDIRFLYLNEDVHCIFTLYIRKTLL